MTRLTFVMFFVAGAALAPAVANAKPKAVGGPPPACGFKALPLAKGNTWTYRSGGQQVLIKVTEVNPNGKDFAGKPATVINLEEQVQGRTVNTTATCTTAGVQFPLDSFFFTAEPGGALNGTTTITERDKATLLPDDQITADNGWVETVKADVVRTDGDSAGAQHSPAKVEMERHVNVKNNEKVMIGLGQFDAQKIVFEVRGRGIIDEAKVELPIKRPGVAYLVKGVGYVKVDDAFDHTWELIDSNLVAK